jgi:hypothetical protein
LPVPTISRERKVLSAMVSKSELMFPAKSSQELKRSGDLSGNQQSS